MASDPNTDNPTQASAWSRPGGYVLRPSRITAEEAVAMVDESLRSHGVEPTYTLMPSGWRRFRVGMQLIICGVVTPPDGVPHLRVSAPLMQLAEEIDLGELFEQMLILNHFYTESTRFSIDDGSLLIGLARPILGLDPDEVDDAIASVVTHATNAMAWLGKAFPEKSQRKLKLEALPKVRLKPKETQALNAFLTQCTHGAREFVSRMMVRWERDGGRFDFGAGTLHLKAPLGQTMYSMAVVQHSLNGPACLILGWEGLRQLGVFSDEAIAAYQERVTALVPVEATETSAQILLKGSTDPALGGKLAAAMERLVRTASGHVTRQTIASTEDNLRATLEACPPDVQEVFQVLVSGWQVAQGTIRANRPGRVALKLAGVRADGERGSSEFAVATLAAPKKSSPASIDLAWNLATGTAAYLSHKPAEVEQFQAASAALPGFETHGTVTRIALEGDFKLQDAMRLLDELLALKRAAGAGRR